MPDMKPAGTSQGARQAGSMTEMMGAPGLVPFDIMTGQAGKWMIGYQFMLEKMAGNLDGTAGVSEASILQRFFAAPTDMTMQMHMGMVMYAPTDQITLMALLPYVRKEMNHLTADGARFAERTDGIGDIELRGMYAVYETAEPRQWLLVSGGVGLPSGSIDATMDGIRLEYPMQIGSGTFLSAARRDVSRPGIAVGVGGRSWIHGPARNERQRLQAREPLPVGRVDHATTRAFGERVGRRPWRALGKHSRVGFHARSNPMNRQKTRMHRAGRASVRCWDSPLTPRRAS